uniref:acetoacetate decarboxylase family protein n=1 Tax=Mycolicibacterium obuense TaxID=1807 RepID=UPI003F582974
MPAFAPLFLPGIERVSVRWISVVYPTSPAVANAVLPPPLADGDSPEVIIWIAQFRGAQFFSPDGAVECRPDYMQGGINLRCRLGDVEGAYAVETFVEGLNHGILGREMFGLPKKQARQVTFQETPTGAEFSFVDAHGQPLLRGAAIADGPDADRIAPTWFDTQYTAKLIPSAEGPRYDISRLVQIPFRLQKTGALRTGNAAIDWLKSPSDPLHLLTQCATPTASWGDAQLDIDYGTYVADLNPADIPVFGAPRW